MALVHVTIRSARLKTSWPIPELPIASATPKFAKTITTDGTSRKHDLNATGDSLVVSVAAVGGNVFVAFGDDPTAGIDAGHLIPAGAVCDFAWGGEPKIAAKDA